MLADARLQTPFDGPFDAAITANLAPERVPNRPPRKSKKIRAFVHAFLIFVAVADLGPVRGPNLPLLLRRKGPQKAPASTHCTPLTESALL